MAGLPAAARTASWMRVSDRCSAAAPSAARKACQGAAQLGHVVRGCGARPPCGRPAPRPAPAGRAAARARAAATPERAPHRVGRARAPAVEHVRAARAAAADVDHAAGLEPGHGLAHRRAADPEQPGQLALGRQAVAGQELAQRDGRQQPVGDLVDGGDEVHRARAGRLRRRAPARAPAARARFPEPPRPACCPAVLLGPRPCGEDRTPSVPVAGAQDRPKPDRHKRTLDQTIARAAEYGGSPPPPDLTCVHRPGGPVPVPAATTEGDAPTSAVARPGTASPATSTPTRAAGKAPLVVLHGGPGATHDYTLVDRPDRRAGPCGRALRPARLRALDAPARAGRRLLDRAAVPRRARQPAGPPRDRRRVRGARPVLGRDARRRARRPAAGGADQPGHRRLARRRWSCGSARPTGCARTSRRRCRPPCCGTSRPARPSDPEYAAGGEGLLRPARLPDRAEPARGGGQLRRHRGRPDRLPHDERPQRVPRHRHAAHLVGGRPGRRASPCRRCVVTRRPRRGDAGHRRSRSSTRIPDVRSEVFADSSHMPHVEEEERYLAVVGAFLDATDRGPAGSVPATADRSVSA